MSERNAGLPIFDMRPNRSLPPLECGFGVKPSQAAKVEWHPGELYPRVGFIVTNLSRPVERVVAF